MLDIPQLLDQARNSQRVPFSFVLGDRPAEFVFRRERPKAQGENPGGTLVFEEKHAPLIVLLEWEENPAHEMLTLEWRILARGSVTEPVRQVQILDLAVGNADAVLHGWNGGSVYRDGGNAALGVYPPHEFREWQSHLGKEPVTLEERDGRSSVSYLPLWILHQDEAGYWFGPEWSGSWNLSASIENGAARVQVGLPCLDFQIHQGEEIPMPRVSLGNFRGGFRDGCVALRRAIRETVMPRIDGKTPIPPAEANYIGGSRPELDHEGVEREVRLAASLGMENFVWAAAWFRPPEGLRSFLTDEEIAELFPHFQDRGAYERMAFWESSGPYVARDESRFGGDLSAFSERMRRMGIRHGLWYDPRFGYKLPEYEENSDALVPPAFRKPQDKGYSEGHVDMSTRAGRELMEEILERIVQRYGAAYIWHDLNTAPRPNYWEEYEEPNRRGLTELFHYHGSDEVYDRFLERHPDIWIMWCGGGGSMINLNVLRRCHSLWIADNNDYSTTKAGDANCDINRAYRTALNWILPSSYITSMLSAGKLYAHRDRIGSRDLLSQFAATYTIHGPLANLNAVDRADIARFAGLFKGVRHFFTKDFWSLFPQPDDRKDWDGWQFHDPETGSGILLFFKRRDCTENERQVTLKWIGDARSLHFGCIEGEASVTGQGANADLRITMSSDCALLRYDSEDLSSKNSFVETFFAEAANDASEIAQ